ncbi:Inositol-1,4,5-trisphosphate 5-phosphatase 1 [Lecanora helva]
MSLAGALADARKSATRVYINNFADKGRQNTIDLLLGRLMGQSPLHLYDPIADYVNAELTTRAHEYTTSSSIKIWAGTFNLNGRVNGIKEDLAPWLWPDSNQSSQPADIVAVGFQEIVELSPQQIMSTDPERRRRWEDAIKWTLNDCARKRGKDEYVLLRSGQLVGAALMIFVKISILTKIKSVEGSVKKTGMSGIAGNKGAVAIRMDYAQTSLCFITAHLAAGFANYEERNRDYQTISHGLGFQRNRTIENHDGIIWLGDFNYRIGLSNERVRQLIDKFDLDTLYENDQMMAGHVFPFYSESRITFRPTYKFDNGTDDYDTSEKPRTPAWCDRIIRKGDVLKQTHYATAPLQFSDHKPVYAIFHCATDDVNEAKKQSLSQDLYAEQKLPTKNSSRHGDIGDSDLVGYDSIAPELPPASSDRQKWWLDDARSNIAGPEGESILNRKRPSNPFTSTAEPDWTMRPTRTKSTRTPPRAATSKIASGNESYPSRAGPFTRSIQIAADEYIARNKDVSSSMPKSSSSARKPAPPVPRKPPSLTSSGDQQALDNPKPAISIARSLNSEILPRLPPRPTEADAGNPTTLLDEDDDGARSLPTLQPTRNI